MITLYREGSSWLHRAPVAAKLVALSVVLFGLSTLGQQWPIMLAGLALSVAGLFSAGFGATWVWSQVFSLRFMIVLMLAPQLIFLPWLKAITNTGSVLSGVLLALLFTATTKTQKLIDLIERAAKPLRFLGLKPQTVGLVFALTLNSIAMIQKFAGSIGEAQLARGIKPRMHRFAVPLLVLSLKHADEYAEALAARGVEL